MSKESMSKKYTLFMNHLFFICDTNNNINIDVNIKKQILLLTNDLKNLLDKTAILDDNNQSWNLELEWAYESILEEYFLLVNYK